MKASMGPYNENTFWGVHFLGHIPNIPKEEYTKQYISIAKHQTYLNKEVKQKQPYSLEKGHITWLLSILILEYPRYVMSLAIKTQP